MSAASVCVSRLVAALARTWRLDVDEAPELVRLRAARRPCLFAVWHRDLLAPLWQRRRQGITLLVSAHGDAECLAAAARGWGYGVVRGSSTRGGAAGLRGIVRALHAGRDGAVTPDGPRGPAEVVKPGLIVAAQRSRAAVIPVGVYASAAWPLASWDGLRIPRPGAHVRIVYGAPLHVAPGRAARAAACRELEQRLSRAAAACTG